MDTHSHWSEIYTTKPATNVSWYQDRPELSLKLIQDTQTDLTAQIIDVGAGASTLVDHLLVVGFQNITLLDISAEALQVTQDRLPATDQTRLKWLVGDITQIELPEHFYDIWHDRAVFHFLTDPLARQRYVEQVRRAVKVGGHIIMATFAPDGPQQCSGLEVMRYDSGELHGIFGDEFKLVHSTNETHVTPWGSEQKFMYCYCRLLDTEYP